MRYTELLPPGESVYIVYEICPEDSDAPHVKMDTRSLELARRQAHEIELAGKVSEIHIAGCIYRGLPRWAL